MVGARNDKLWDEGVEEIESYVDNVYFDHKRKQFFDLIKKWSEDKINGKILKIDLYEEATSRRCEVAFSLAKKGKVVGIDISPAIVNLAKKNCKGEKVDFLVQDVRKMKSFKDNTFDLVLSHSTLDHIIEIEDAFKEIHRVMKPGGILIVTINNKTNPLIPFAKDVGKVVGPFFGAKSIYETYSFDVIGFRRLIRKMGFKVEKSTGSVFVMPMMPTFINWAYKNDVTFVKNFFKSYFRFLERVGKKNTWLNYFMGLQVAVKARKI